MIVSHSNRFIFIKARKVAGTAVERTLAPYLGPGDEWLKADDVQHMSPVQARAKVGNDVWDAYFKFVCIRNPWDALASLYFFGHQPGRVDRPPMFFKDFVNWNLRGGMPLNVDMFSFDGQPYVDWADAYLKVESLNADLNVVLTKLGLPAVEVPVVNASTKRQGTHYSLLYDAQSRDTVHGVYQAFNERHGYTFQHWQDVANDD